MALLSACEELKVDALVDVKSLPFHSVEWKLIDNWRSLSSLENKGNWKFIDDIASSRVYWPKRWINTVSGYLLFTGCHGKITEIDCSLYILL